jgi:hypothetical protein
MEQSKGSGELIQCGSDISTIKHMQDMDTLFSWVFMDLDGAANQHWHIQWDPGGYMFAVCSLAKRWTTLHCYAHLQWSSLQLAGAFRIWLVAWAADGLKFFGGHGQAPFQGGRNAIRPVFTDQVHVNQDNYIAYINQILVDSAYYLEQSYSKASAWGQAEFQGGMDVRTLSQCMSHWAGTMGSQRGTQPSP